MGLKNPDAPSLSVKSINNAAANVGTATTVISEDVRYAHAKSGILLSGKSGCLHFIIVTMKLIEPNIEELSLIHI